MPYSGPRDKGLPDNIKELSEKKRSQWVSVWNSAYERCMDDKGDADACETFAFKNANGVVFNNTLSFSTNSTTLDAVRKEYVDGLEYLVAPVVSICESVMNGELLLAEEFGRHPTSWDGRPVVISHPLDGAGLPISANNPSVLERYQVGHVYNTKANGNLKHEMWIDMRRARRTQEGQELLRRLQHNQPVEVSTGYYRDLDATPGVRGSRPYYGIARNIRPDHLAVLLNETGACSWADGCGAPRLNREDAMRINIRSSARTPDYEGTSSGEWSAPDWEKIVRSYYRQHPDAEGSGDDTPNVKSAPAALKRWAANLSLLGDAEAEDFRNLVFFPVVDPGTKKLNEAALGAVISGRGAQADIPAKAKSSAQNKARSLLEKEFDRDLSENAVMAAAKRLASDLQSLITLNERRKTMDERIQTILAAEKGFTKDGLKAMSECELDALIALLSSDDEPTTNEDETPDEDPGEDTDRILQLVNEILGDVGGVDGLKEALGSFKSNSDRERKDLIGRLVANDQCRLSAEDLEQMGTETLKRLWATFRPVDYGGLGGEPIVTHEDEEIVAFPVPSVWAKEE